jgi:hypothetical protein
LSSTLVQTFVTILPAIDPAAMPSAIAMGL